MSDFFERLELQLREAAVRRPRGLPDLSGAAVAALALALVALALMPVLLLGGGEDGDPRPASGPPKEWGLPPLPNGRIVAAGETPVAGAWQTLTYRSERLADPQSGEEYQPAGLRCLGLALLDPPGGEFADLRGAVRGIPAHARLQSSPALSARQRCHRRGDPRLRPAAGRSRRRPAHAEGAGPDRGRAVRGAAGARGDFYLIAVSPDTDGGRVNWIDKGGNEGSRGIALLPP